MLNITISNKDNKIICKANQEIASFTMEINKDRLLGFIKMIPDVIESIITESTSEKIAPIIDKIDSLNQDLEKLHARADKESTDLTNLKEQLEALKA